MVWDVIDGSGFAIYGLAGLVVVGARLPFFRLVSRSVWPLLYGVVSAVKYSLKRFVFLSAAEDGCSGALAVAQGRTVLFCRSFLVSIGWYAMNGNIAAIYGFCGLSFLCVLP